MTTPDYTLWARAEVAGQIEEPPTAKKDQGWDYLEKPAHEYWNWVLNNTGKWIRGMQGAYADIIVGSAAEVTAFEATHTIANFAAAIVNGDKIHLLAGTHTMTVAITITEANLIFTSDANAIINQASTHLFTLSGPDARAELRFSNGFSDGVVVSGIRSYVTLYSLNMSMVLLSSGVGGVVNHTTGGIISSGLGTVADTAFQFAGDSNTGPYSPGADQWAVATAGVQAMAIAADQGITMAGTLGVTGAATFSGTITGSNVDVFLNSTSADNVDQELVFRKDRSGGIITQNDHLGTVRFRGEGGSGQLVGALIRVRATGTPSATEIPSSMEFFTANASGVSTQALTIDFAQQVLVEIGTASTSSSTGALVVTGGIGSGGQISTPTHFLSANAILDSINTGNTPSRWRQDANRATAGDLIAEGEE